MVWERTGVPSPKHVYHFIFMSSIIIHVLEMVHLSSPISFHISVKYNYTCFGDGTPDEMVWERTGVPSPKHV
jgi:hypothetical protein